MSTIPIFGDELPIPRCPGGCGGEAPLAFPCPSCERPFHPDGPAAQCAKVMAIAEMRLLAHAAECEAHQKTIKTAAAEYASAYVQLKGLPALYTAKVAEILAARQELMQSPQDAMCTLLELVRRRMSEHQDMTNRLTQLETPVADMTPSGVARKAP